MEVSGRPATWLEMVGLPQWHAGKAEVRIHPVVGPQGACYALTLDRRWLCGTDGSVTLFQGLAAAERFLQLAHVDDYEPGAPADLAGRLDKRVQCLCVRQGRNLRACQRRGPGCPSGEGWS